MGGKGCYGRKVGWREGMGALVVGHANGIFLSSLPAVVNTTGGGGSGLAFGGTMGSNALRFLSDGGPGTLKAYSIRTTSATRRSALN